MFKATDMPVNFHDKSKSSYNMHIVPMDTKTIGIFFQISSHKSIRFSIYRKKLQLLKVKFRKNPNI